MEGGIDPDSEQTTQSSIRESRLEEDQEYRRDLIDCMNSDALDLIAKLVTHLISEKKYDEAEEVIGRGCTLPGISTLERGAILFLRAQMYTSRADSITEQNPMYGPKNGLACPEAEDWFEKRQQVRKQISQCKLDDQDWDYVKRFSDENVDGWAFYPGFCLLAQEPLDIYSTASRRPNQKFLLVNEVVFPSTEESASNRWTVETGSWHVYQHALNAAIEYMTAAHRSHKPIMLCLQRDLAEVYHELRQYEKDGLLYRAVLETQKKHDFFGPENPDTVLTMTKLVEHYARGYGSAEDREAGKVMSHELYDINKKILRQDNPKTERSWDLVAQLDHKEVALKACGDYIESRKERKAKRTSKDILWLIILRLKLIGHGM